MCEGASRTRKGALTVGGCIGVVGRGLCRVQ
jgi:hypothetical protein